MPVDVKVFLSERIDAAKYMSQDSLEARLGLIRNLQSVLKIKFGQFKCNELRIPLTSDQSGISLNVERDIALSEPTYFVRVSVAEHEDIFALQLPINSDLINNDFVYKYSSQKPEQYSFLAQMISSSLES